MLTGPDAKPVLDALAVDIEPPPLRAVAREVSAPGRGPALAQVPAAQVPAAARRSRIPPIFLNRKQAASYLGLSVRTLANMAAHVGAYNNGMGRQRYAAPAAVGFTTGRSSTSWIRDKANAWTRAKFALAEKQRAAGVQAPASGAEVPPPVEDLEPAPPVEVPPPVEDLEPAAAQVPAAQTAEDSLTRKQAAQLLGLSVKALKTSRAKRVIPPAADSEAVPASGRYTRGAPCSNGLPPATQAAASNRSFGATRRPRRSRPVLLLPAEVIPDPVVTRRAVEVPPIPIVPVQPPDAARSV